MPLTKPTLIGICGRKRHGKNEVGSILTREFAFLPTAFADPLKQTLMQIYNLQYDQVYGDLKEVVDARYQITPREIMQNMGAIVRKVHVETWIRKTFDTIYAAERGEYVTLHTEALRDYRETASDTHKWCITDVRHVNEAEAVRAAGGKIIKIHRPSMPLDQFSNDASETAIDDIDPDFLIVNDGSLEQLGERARHVASLFGLHPETTKLCSSCGHYKPVDKFSPHKATKDKRNITCKTCKNKRAKEWRRENLEQSNARAREHHLMYTYGITKEQYETMLARQGGVCALCDALPTTKALAVDHSHDTGAIRGLLCVRCNHSLERLETIPGWADRAAQYLNKATVGGMPS